MATQDVKDIRNFHKQASLHNPRNDGAVSYLDKEFIIISTEGTRSLFHNEQTRREVLLDREHIIDEDNYHEVKGNFDIEGELILEGELRLEPEDLTPEDVGLARSFVRYVPTTTPNINTASLTEIAMLGALDQSLGAGFSTSGNAIQCDFDGSVTIHFCVRTTSAVARVNTMVGVYLNGVLLSQAATDYTRNASGHSNASLGGSLVINVTSGDLLTLEGIQEAAAGTNSLVIAGSHLTVSRYS